MTDKRLVRIINASSLAILIICMFLPGEYSGRITAAVAFLPITAATLILVKKRAVLSLYRRQILFLMSVMGIVYLILYYLSGLAFGFVKNIYTISPEVIFLFVLPTTVIIIASELVRAVMIAQEDKPSYALSYIFCVIAEVIIYYDVTEVHSFAGFMDLLGIALLPAIISGVLYHYLAKRYGAAPNIAFRLLTTLYYYLFPYIPGMADSLFALANLIIPVIIYIFFDSLYDRKRRYALGKKSRLAVPLTVIVATIMVSVMLLISNQFRYGALVIATDSMTGELNKGDIVIFEQRKGQMYEEGQVIIFKSSETLIVHRIVKIENINGALRYYTKGDFNEDVDPGFITESDVVGSARAKLPYFGYPTVWLREIFTPSE